MKIEDKFLPKSCYSDKLIYPAGIVLHFISAINVTPEDPFNMETCRKILEDYSFSYHELIGRDGEIWQLVPEPDAGLYKAYHAGKSEYKGKKNWNNFAVGMCFAGTKDSGFTDAQYESGLKRVTYYLNKFSGIRDIVGHEDIAGFRGKVDPGIKTGNFDLSRVIP